MENKIKEILYQAGNMLKKAHCNREDIDSKPGESNFVTKYDVSIQQFLKNKLLQLFPSAVFAGEEGEDDKFTDNGICFLVDPIDGTTNFIKDYKHSCISVAILNDGKVFFGAVYNPYLDELFFAKRGEGAFLNGKSIHVSDAGLRNSLIMFGTAPYYPELTDKTFDDAKKLLKFCADIRRSGSAALDICYVAAGRCELYFEHVLSPWDYAAASLIVEEAGGIIKTKNGKDIRFDKKCAIVSASTKAFNEFIKIVDF